jgi:hypothetical protein
VTLAANTPIVGTGAWTIVSGVGGSFVDATDPLTMFNGTQGTVYGLRWTISNGTCTPSSDDVSITLDQNPTTADAGIDQAPCGPTTLAANTPVVGTGIWSIVSGAGGLFSNTASPTSTFSGTAGTTYQLRWTISNGTCTPSTDDVQIQFDVNTPTTSAAGPDQNICNTSATLAANTPVVGTGGWSIVTGAGGSFVDATDPATTFNGTAGTAYTLRWTITSIGGCTPSTDDVDITFNQAPTTAAAGVDQAVCNPVTLAGNTPIVGTGSWSIVTGAGGSIANASNPTSGFTGASGSTYTLRWTITNGGCTASSDDVTITINSAGSCGATNCFAFNITIDPVLSKRPSCNNGQNDGLIVLNVSGAVPGNYIISLLSNGTPVQPPQIGPSGTYNFPSLSPGHYQYKVQDQAGNVCIQDFDLLVNSTIQASAAGFVDAICFNQAVGQATVTVTSGGASPFEYSLDAGTTWVSFTSPVTITNLMPAAAPYSILVRDDAADLCPAQVSVSINNSVSDILITSTTANASCSNDDGSVQITSVSGGSGPYTYQFDGQAQLGISYSSLPAGNHTFVVTDANNCVKSFPFVLTSPGYVDFNPIVTNPTCNGGGNDGRIDVTINTSGNFDVGITTDIINIPPNFVYTSISNTVTPVTFNSLSQGKYFIVVKPNGALCSTDSAKIINGGPSAVDFEFVANNFVCFETKGTVDVYNIKGSNAVDYTFEIINTGNIIRTGTITQLQTLDTVRLPLPQAGLDKGDYQVRIFQDQSASTGCVAPITSTYKDFLINGPTRASFDTLSVKRTNSELNLATGTMTIDLQNTFAPPYLLNLHLLASDIPGQNNNHNSFEAQWIPLDSTRLPIEFVAGDLYAGLYRLSIIDKFGCERIDSLTISVDAKIFIPNIFTPNNDGKNDSFEILNLPAKSSILITNRWGKEVYKGNIVPSTDILDPNNPSISKTVVWNGGAEVDGIYFYTLSTPSKTYTGWIELQH